MNDPTAATSALVYVDGSRVVSIGRSFGEIPTKGCRSQKAFRG
jgi:hypothetical protein